MVVASEADEGGAFLTDAGMRSLQEAMEAKEVVDSTAKASLAGGGALGALVFRSEDLNQSRGIVAAVLGEFLGYCPPERSGRLAARRSALARVPAPGPPRDGGCRRIRRWY